MQRPAGTSRQQGLLRLQHGGQQEAAHLQLLVSQVRARADVLLLPAQFRMVTCSSSHQSGPFIERAKPQAVMLAKPCNIPVVRPHGSKRHDVAPAIAEEVPWHIAVNCMQVGMVGT
jgi:hypothetical protein